MPKKIYLTAHQKADPVLRYEIKLKADREINFKFHLP